ncbi:MAG: CidA/LrgA family protein [Schaedlerella sp.]|nr:CidA/LrgA family protein [Lachnospiraceae bacterium]MDY4202889.1 CidA/LrgA family protein [Schaedlerella sp.]
MKYLQQFSIILIISFVGEILHHIIPFPIPASIYGIVILFLLLEFNILPLSSVKDAGKFLIEIMPVMFIPAAVELMDVWDVIRPSFLPYIIITLASTVIVMAVSGKVTEFIVRKKKAGENHE